MGILVHLNFGALITSCNGVLSHEVEVWRKSPPRPPLKRYMDRCMLRTSGVWGEAPASNDFGAFFYKKEAS